MNEPKVPEGTIKVKKTLADLKLGLTTIILTPENANELEYILENIDEIPKDVDEFYCEVILVSKANLSKEHIENLIKKGVCVQFIPGLVRKCALQNIGRQLASKESKYLLFLDDFNDVSKEWLENRVRGFEFNPVIGIIGRSMPKVTDELKQELFNGLQGLIRLSDEDFKERCCDKEGGFRNVCSQTLATPTAVFDRIGGFDILNEYPDLVYQARVQALGYGLVPLPN